jgi:hypothetical protein
LRRLDHKARIARATDIAIEAVATPGVQLDAEHADAVTIFHACIGGIVRFARNIHLQHARHRRVHKARLTGT